MGSNMFQEARDKPNPSEILAPGVPGEPSRGGKSVSRDSSWWNPDSTDLLRCLDGMPLLRQLALERGFRWMCLMWVGVVMFLALSAVPVWVVTPPGFVPVLRISGLDYLESMEHGRRCERAWERGAVDEALAEWKTALARHPARIRLLRRGLERVASCSALERRDPRYQAVVANGFWLLRLTGTNRVDADLVVRALDGALAENGLSGFLERLPGKRTPVQRAVKLLAGIRTRGFGECEPNWPMATGIRALDRDLALGQLGWAAARAGERAAQQAWQQLELASSLAEERIWATQLQLWALAARGDLLGYETVLARLQRFQGDLPVHAVGHWNLLVKQGRWDEARDLAMGYRGIPVNGQEVGLLAEAFLGLGLEEWAFQFLGRQVAFGNPGLEVWLLYSGELARRARWEQLSDVGAQLRALGGSGGWQQGFGLYLDGLSRHGRGERALARRCFEAASRCVVRPVQLGVELGRRALELGYADCGLHWLEYYEREFAGDRDYWRYRARAARETGSWAALEVASKRRLEIDPGNLPALNDWVMARLTREEFGEGLVAQSEFALSLDPDSVTARLNRVMVLIRIGRFAEARAWLSLMGEGEVGHGDMGNRVRAARFELHARTEEREQAFDEWGRLDVEGLDPAWKERLRKLRRTLELRGNWSGKRSISTRGQSN